MKIAVLVQVSSTDPANDAEDRKVVAHDQNALRVRWRRMISIKLFHARAATSAKPLPAGHINIRRFAAPAGEKFAVPGFYFVESQSFESPWSSSRRLFFDYHRQVVRPADDFGGLARAAEVLE